MASVTAIANGASLKVDRAPSRGVIPRSAPTRRKPRRDGQIAFNPSDRSQFITRKAAPAFPKPDGGAFVFERRAKGAPPLVTESEPLAGPSH